MKKSSGMRNQIHSSYPRGKGVIYIREVKGQLIKYLHCLKLTFCNMSRLKTTLQISIKKSSQSSSWVSVLWTFKDSLVIKPSFWGKGTSIWRFSQVRRYAWSKLALDFLSLNFLVFSIFSFSVLTLCAINLIIIVDRKIILKIHYKNTWKSYKTKQQWYAYFCRHSKF